jgi:myo-inositol-1(or 4)-monophosphatase
MASGEQFNLVDEGIWVVDPIDGTDCFIYGIPCWCISFARIQNGEAKIGIIYDPLHDEMYSAVTGLGAELNGVTLQISDTSELHEGITGMGYSTRVEPIIASAPGAVEKIKMVSGN